MNKKPNEHRPAVSPANKKPVPPTHKSFFAEFTEALRDEFSKENIRRQSALLWARTKASLRNFGIRVFYARDRVLCGVVAAFLMILMALLQTTVFSSLRLFGSIPDLMLVFTVALSVTEGGKWGAVWGIVSAVIIESLGIPDVTLLPLLYMPAGYFCGLLCTYRFTGSAAVRSALTLAVIPFRAIFTVLYMVLSPLYSTPGEIFFGVVLPEAGATLVLAPIVHLLVFLCMRPFHRTRAEMVSEK